jgi:hypothetical protein
MDNQTQFTPTQLGKALYSGLFAARDNLHDAYEFATQIADASDNPAAVMTAVQVVVNTIAVELLAMGARDE